MHVHQSVSLYVTPRATYEKQESNYCSLKQPKNKKKDIYTAKQLCMYV